MKINFGYVLLIICIIAFLKGFLNIDLGENSNFYLGILIWVSGIIWIYQALPKKTEK